MVVAPMRLARLALPGMRERGEGRIVNVSSIYGRVTTPFTGWYQAAKHALEGVTDALRMEVAGMGVKVVLVEPGGFRTAIFDEVKRDLDRRGPLAVRARLRADDADAQAHPAVPRRSGGGGQVGVARSWAPATPGPAT